jgi:CBS domain-containing membrane protein
MPCTAIWGIRQDGPPEQPRLAIACPRWGALPDIGGPLEPDEQRDRIAEYADSSVRVLHRRGSLLGVPGSYGLKRALYKRWGNRGNAVYTFTGSLLAISTAGLAAWAFDEPLLFPSLGATAFLIFETPTADVGTPRNTIIGHAVAIGCAVLSLAVFGLLGDPSAFEEGVTLARALAVALSVGLTGGILRLLRAAHPPAGATTIIVSSGLLAEGDQILAVAVGVLIVTAAGWLLNRALGVPARMWAGSR